MAQPNSSGLEEGSDNIRRASMSRVRRMGVLRRPHCCSNARAATVASITEVLLARDTHTVDTVLGCRGGRVVIAR